MHGHALAMHDSADYTCIQATNHAAETCRKIKAPAAEDRDEALCRRLPLAYRFNEALAPWLRNTLDWTAQIMLWMMPRARSQLKQSTLAWGLLQENIGQEEMCDPYLFSWLSQNKDETSCHLVIALCLSHAWADMLRPYTWTLELHEYSSVIAHLGKRQRIRCDS